MIYSIQLYTERRTNRRDAFSASREHVATVRCSELRCNGQPVAYAMRSFFKKNDTFFKKVTLVKVFVLVSSKKGTKWTLQEVRML